MANGKEKQKTRSRRPLEDAVYRLFKSEGRPFSVREIRIKMLSERLIDYSEIGEVDRALAGDGRFKRWGSSNYWILFEWKDYDGLYPFLREKACALLEKAGRPVHYRKLAEAIGDSEGVEVSPGQMKDALETYWGRDIHGDKGVYWNGRKDKPGVTTVASAVRWCVEHSTRLQTFNRVYQCVREMLPEHDIKKKTVSGTLSRNKEFHQYFGAFWAAAGLSDEWAAKRLAFTGRQGFGHVVSGAQLKNCTLQVRAEYLPFLPEEESSVIIETEKGSLHACHYQPGSGYVSGMGPVYRQLDIKLGDTVLFCAVDPDNCRFWIEKKRTEGISRRISMMLDSIAGMRINTSRMGHELGSADRMVCEGSKPGSGLILVSPHFDPDIVIDAVRCERRVLVHATSPLDRLLARSFSNLPESKEFMDAGHLVAEKARERIFSLYELDEDCEECGSRLVADRVMPQRLTAHALCLSCGETRGSSCELSPSDVNKMARIEENSIELWHPDESSELYDIYTRRSVLAQSILFAEIGKVKDGSIKDLLLCCFFESMGIGRFGHRKNYHRSHEMNPWFEFVERLKRKEHHLDSLRESDCYFLECGGVDEVLDGTATFAWSERLDSLPPSVVDAAVVIIPSALVPASALDRVCAYWLAEDITTGGASGSVGFGHYVAGLLRVLKPSGRLNLVVEPHPGFLRLFVLLDPLLKRIGFNFVSTLPEPEDELLEDREHSQLLGFDALVYEKGDNGSST